MEFFCELWIRWNINISLEYFEIYSGREGGKKKRKKYRSIDTFALSNPSVSRPMNNTENGRWLVRWLLSARTERGEKKENGRKIIKRLLLFRDNLFAIIFVYKYYTFFYGCFFLILLKSTVCNDKLTIWELFIRWGPSVCFIYYFSFFSFFFLSQTGWLISSAIPSRLWRFIGNKSLGIVHPRRFLETMTWRGANDRDLSTAGCAKQIAR